jgi:mRNA interferase HicA
MRGQELIKKLQKLAKIKGVEFRLDQKRGKGSHITLYFDKKFTIIRNPKDELKTGTFNAILKQIGVSKDELES